MYGESQVAPRGWKAEDWRENELYLFGVDLFNDGYWWEAHAAWEALWQTTERSEATARFLQGLIQITAALVQDRAGRAVGARRLASKGVAKVRGLGRKSRKLGSGSGRGAIRFMGVEVDGFATAVERFFEPMDPGRAEVVVPPLLVLA
jgi:predicted metal-dependent hydrolase